MIAYNVTVKVEHDVHDDWLQWMRETHIPDVMNTKMFVEHRLFRLMEQDESQGITYAIQYFAKDMSDYFTYQNEHAPALQKEHTERYKDKFVAFRTILRVIE